MSVEREMAENLDTDNRTDHQKEQDKKEENLRSWDFPVYPLAHETDM